MSTESELKRLLARLRERQDDYMYRPHPAAVDEDKAAGMALSRACNELEPIIRKYEEPTEAMVKAGVDSLRRSLGGHESIVDNDARACFKAMIEAEDKDHD